jgi:hypothetical protein
MLFHRMSFPNLVKLTLILAPALVYTTALHFEPTQTRLGLQASTIGLPAITSEAHHDGLSGRQAGRENPTCGWINGNGGM